MTVPPEHTPHARLRRSLERHAHTVGRMVQASRDLQAQRDQERQELAKLIAEVTDPNGPPTENQGQAA